MLATVPLDHLKIRTIESLEPGSFFYTMPDIATPRAYKLRVDLGDPNFAGVVALDGEDAFSLGRLRVNHARDGAIHVPTSGLHVRLAEAREGNYDVPGNLFVTADDAQMLVRIPRMGDAYDDVYVSLHTWTVVAEHPSRASMFPSWQIIARSPDRDEVLLSVGA